MGIHQESFGKLEDNTSVDLYTLSNSGGMKATITSYGGAVVSLQVPDQS